MTILAIQRDDRLVIFTRDDQGVDHDVELLAPDDAERFANAILAAVPRVRETEAATKRQTLTAALADIEAQRNALQSQLASLPT